MKTNKLKLLSIAVCYFVAALWSEPQCGDHRDQRNDEPVRNHQAGFVNSFAGEIPPDGWLLCDGKIYSSVKYPELYKVIGTKYASNDTERLELLIYNEKNKGNELFRVPDMRRDLILNLINTGQASAINLHQCMMNFEPEPGLKYTLKSVSSSGYLDGRHQTGIEAYVTNRDPSGDKYLQWDIRKVDGHYVLKSVSSSGYLDGRNQTGIGAYVTNRDPSGDKYLQWDITKGR